MNIKNYKMLLELIEEAVSSEKITKKDAEDMTSNLKKAELNYFWKEILTTSLGFNILFLVILFWT
jgi:hypothetical protein